MAVSRISLGRLPLVFLSACALSAVPAVAQPSDGMAAVPTYADLVSLADSAPLAIKAEVRSLARVKDERAPGLAPAHGRFYVEARTISLLAGGPGIGQSLAYLVDLPLDSKGRPPRLKKEQVVLFARPVAGRPGELQLLNNHAQLPWSAALEARVRDILTELLSPDAPAAITGVRELLYVPGNLAGQGETQIFLATADRSAASITVRHQPGRGPVWGASFSELVADTDSPPEPETLVWYRLACALPDTPPASANVSGSAADRRQAAADYRTVLGHLGPCERNFD
jgi:hypothetical protein